MSDKTLAKCIKNEWKKHPSKITSVLDIINTDHGPKKRIKLCEKNIQLELTIGLRHHGSCRQRHFPTQGAEHVHHQ